MGSVIRTNTPGEKKETGALLAARFSFLTFYKIMSYLYSHEGCLQPDSSREVCTCHTESPLRSVGSGRSAETTDKECKDCWDWQLLLKARLYLFIIRWIEISRKWLHLILQCQFSELLEIIYFFQTKLVVVLLPYQNVRKSLSFILTECTFREKNTSL